jgi:hypothetical protein
MTDTGKLSPHEIIELRELLNTEMTGLKKLQISSTMVKDEELKCFMSKCMDSKKNKINSMKSFIENNMNIGQEGNSQCQS